MQDQLILLVDKDADCAALILEAGARTGCGVRLARDSGDALAAMRREFDRICCIVLDLDPDTRGLALLKAIQPLRHRPPVIVLTSLEPSQMATMAIRLGAAQCLGKPVPIEQLAAAIKQIVGSAPDQVRPSDPEVDCDPGAAVLPCVL